jgi:hypothetical protein
VEFEFPDDSTTIINLLLDIRDDVRRILEVLDEGDGEEDTGS